MNAVFTKLNYKAQAEVVVLNAPEEFLSLLTELTSQAIIVHDPEQIQQGEFIIAFVKKQQEVIDLVPLLASRLQGDGILWFAYPKGSSRKYTCNFNRDTGWVVLEKYGFAGVRQVAIDEDWSALRFRRVEYIKKMTRQRSQAMTDQGKAKLVQ
ncbi:hypothetical protein HNV11_01400 [Spirosoma taeanense]|uniref:DUF3052 family protein n=1 Tax=Spirosoma taeanense TaxID=2735870 RepID=A0A6M5Y414_9BACT|nr:hypothetical protein [Spirosoma taeanense]QJW88126.1 hypothetical protein HNV11_01400 [Spirosoma taeanense]